MNRRQALTLIGAASAALATRDSSALGSSERKLWTDPETQVDFWQVTSFPTVNENLYFHSRCWTADSLRFVFQSRREARRGASSDLYMVNAEGLNLVQLTDGISYSNVAVHPEKSLCYFNRGNEVFKLSLDTLQIDSAGKIEGDIAPGEGSPGSFTNDGRLYCITWRSTDGKEQGFATFNTRTGESRRIRIEAKDSVSHMQIEPGRGERVQFVTHPAPGKSDIYVSDFAGKLTRLPFEQANGHNAWLGSTGKVYTDNIGERRDILACMPGSDKVEVIAPAPPNFWHTGISPEGDWMVSDTNSPDDGLWLINTRNGKHTRLLRAGSSQGHSQYTHPHPCVSPGGRRVIFNSDRTGIPHVFVAEIPDAMRKSLE